MAEFTLHIPIKIFSNKEVVDEDRRSQSCATRTSYAYLKKNGIHLSANDMIKSDSAVQNLLSERNSTSKLNYWLKQSAIRRAAWLDSANETVRKEDDKEYDKLFKEIKKCQKKIENLEKKLNKRKDIISKAREKLSLAKTDKQKSTWSKKINDALGFLSNAKNKRDEIKQLKKQIKKAESKIKDIEIRRKKNYTTVFGGRDEFIKRAKGETTHDEFVSQRLMSLYSVGDTEHGNRLFDIEFTKVVYKRTKDEHIDIEFDLDRMTENEKIELARLIMCVAEGMCPVTVTVTDTHVNLTADTIWLYKNEIKAYRPVPMRFGSLDGNPMEYGISITDWKSSGRYDIKYTNVFSINTLFDEWFKLNEEKDVASDDPRRMLIHHKIEFETLRVARFIAILAEHYKVEYFVVEELNIKSGDVGNSVSNTKCNNLWKRELFYEVLEKECSKRGIRFIKVKPDYSSFEGNIIFRKHELEPDMNLAAREIGRRGYEFVSQHIIHTKQPMKNVVFPDIVLFTDSFKKSMEELQYDESEFRGWKSFFTKVTKTGKMYRRKLGDIKSPGMTRFYSKQSKVT